ncbi:hypothetical protein AB3S75_006245 [Citrus x aurantiifolia]
MLKEFLKDLIWTRQNLFVFHFQAISSLVLTSKHCPTSEKEKQEMRGVPYASAVGSLMYAMILKWILRYLRGGAVSWQSRLRQYITLSTIKT